MPEIDPVILQLRADVARYNAELQQTARRVTASLDLQEGAIIRLENQMNKGFTRIGSAANRAQAVVGSSVKAMGTALAGLLTIQTAQQFLKIADEAKGMDATLKLATASFGSLAQAQADVDRIADDTRSGLVETTDLYSSFIRASQELGKGQSDAARATETFSKALKVGGAGTQEVASATLQMGQALSSANIQWEELGQILEASPRLGRLFTEALGVTLSLIHI